MLNCDWNGFGYKEAVGSGGKDPSTMIFGRGGAKQTQAPQGSAGGGQQGAPGYASNATPWQTAGGTPLAGSYPTQQAGTGYAGYTPGNTGAGYTPGANTYSAQTGGYTAGGYGTGAQNPAQGGGYTAGGYAAGVQNPAQAGGYTTAGGYGAGIQNPAQGGGYAAGRYSAGIQNPAQGSGYAPGGYGTGVQNPAQTGGYAQTGYSAPGSAYNTYNAAGTGYGTPGGQVTGGYPGPGTNPAGAAGYGQPYGGGNYAPQGGTAYGYPQMNGGTGYPHGQNGYPTAGNNPYAQMGRNQQGPAQMGGQQPDYSRQQIPLNGGGYVPQQIPVKKQPFVFNDGMLILMCAALLALFAVGLFVPGLNTLLWIFLVLAAGAVTFFWVKPVMNGNRRLCFTIIFSILAIVALLNVTGILAGARDRRQNPTGNEPAVTASVSVNSSTGVNSGTVIDPETGRSLSAGTEARPTATPTAAAEDNSATDRLEAFFRYWSAGMQDEMLNLCSPTWQSGVDNPKTALFGLLANRRPLDYTVEKISGTSESTSRTVTVTSTIDRNNGKDPVKYRLSVLMVKENEQWYVDPQSLKTYENAETPDPATAATPTPTAEPAASASTVLYYNPDGGTKYHLDQNCKSTHAKYLPMKGHFTYGEINNDKYKNLSPCNVCAAPLRP